MASKKQCSVCGKKVFQLSRHMRQKHQIYPSNQMIPQNLKSFIEMISLFPISLSEWKVICNNRKDVIQYLENETPLPPSLFSLFYQSYERYKSDTNTSKLAILKCIQNPLTKKSSLHCISEKISDGYKPINKNKRTLHYTSEKILDEDEPINKKKKM